MFKGIEFFKGKSRGEGVGLLRRYTPRNDVCSVGRSMIEMLGVLAIIGVLSVGGIAGYGKAMEKFKVNKIVDDFNMLIFNLMEHKDSLAKGANFQNNVYHLADIVYSLNLVPNTWKHPNANYLTDSMGNWLTLYYRVNQSESYNGIVIDYSLGSAVDVVESFNNKLCFELFNTIIIPLHGALKRGRIYPDDSTIYFGDAYCGTENTPCLKDLNFTKVKQICNSCTDNTAPCHITVNF